MWESGLGGLKSNDRGRWAGHIETILERTQGPEDILPRVFDAFFTTKTGGVGLGLTSVQRAVERHQGRIEVSSVVGEDTTVTILLQNFDVATSTSTAAAAPIRNPE